MRRFLKIITPDFIIRAYKNQKSKKRKVQRETIAKSGNTLSQKQIEEKLLSIGIKNGDVVMVHSSLSSLGNVEQGAEAIVNAFLKVIGNSGTLVMPAFPAVGFNYDYLLSKPVFDIKLTPSKMGLITEVFRKMNGVKRSFHPTDSVIAFGKEAENITKDHFGQLTPYNQNSPFFKLIQLKAKIVLLGVRLETVTNFHTPEDAISNFKYPVYAANTFDVKMIDEWGEIHTMTTKVHNPVFSKKRKCNEFKVPFIQEGFAREFNLGLASCMIIEADKMHDWLMDSYKRGITMYNPNGETII